MMLTAAKNVTTGEIVTGPGLSHADLIAGRPGPWIEGYLHKFEFLGTFPPLSGHLRRSARSGYDLEHFTGQQSRRHIQAGLPGNDRYGFAGAVTENHGTYPDHWR